MKNNKDKNKMKPKTRNPYVVLARGRKQGAHNKKETRAKQNKKWRKDIDTSY